jgi:hypothetical protein
VIRAPMGRGEGFLKQNTKSDSLPRNEFRRLTFMFSFQQDNHTSLSRTTLHFRETKISVYVILLFFIFN